MTPSVSRMAFPHELEHWQRPSPSRVPPRHRCRSARIAVQSACAAFPRGLHDTASALGALERGGVTPQPQSEDGVTYAKKISKEEARIDWSRPALELDRHIRALSPFPGAWTQFGKERIKILAVEIVSDRNGPPGQTLDDALLIGCGTWALRATLIQREGKRPMPADESLRGNLVPRSSVLG